MHIETRRWLILPPHQCIDLPSAKRESSRVSKAATKAKGKEPATSSSTDQLDYVDNLLYDRILRDDLKVAYEGFRVRILPGVPGTLYLTVIQ
jgi:hypothetical protein